MKRAGRFAGLILALACAVIAPRELFAHCDGLDGPVVQAAEQALESGDVNRVLIWVQKSDEPEIRRVFDQTLAVRKLSPEAKTLADRAFFETLVRVHRAGEGAPFTGLKPAGRDLGPVIPAADNALSDNSPESLIKMLTAAVDLSVREHYAAAAEKKNFAPDDLEAGRAFISAYVTYIHSVEAVHQALERAAHGHFDDSPAAAAHRED